MNQPLDREQDDDQPRQEQSPLTQDVYARAGLGIGSALFTATRAAAKRLGYAWINATIRADNPVGLAYYQSRGFRDWHLLEDVPLGDGTVVDKICKRFDLD